MHGWQRTRTRRSKKEAGRVGACVGSKKVSRNSSCCIFWGAGWGLGRVKMHGQVEEDMRSKQGVKNRCEEQVWEAMEVL